MSCEHCSPDESECGVCRDWDRRRSYSVRVSWVCLSVLVLIVVVAAVCGLWSKFGGNH